MVEDRVKFISSVVYHMGYAFQAYFTIFVGARYIDPSIIDDNPSISDWFFIFGCNLLSSIKPPSNIYTPSQINDLITEAIKADSRVRRNLRRLPFFSWAKRVKETIYSLAANLIGTSVSAAGIPAWGGSKFLNNNEVLSRNLFFLIFCVSVSVTSLAKYVHDYPFSKKIELIPLILPLCMWDPLRIFEDNKIFSLDILILCMVASRLVEAGRALSEIVEYFYDP